MNLQSLSVFLMLLASGYCNSQTSDQPNILLVLCDDLNLLGLGTIVDPALQTPYIDSLVGESVVFTNAHANAAGCGPSRASMFSGILPQTSGHSGYKMGQNSWLDNPILGPATSVFKQFLDNGYDVYGAGKVYHSSRQRDEDFTESYKDPKQGPYPSDSRNHPDLPESFDEYDLSFATLENVPEYEGFGGWVNAGGSPFFFESDENRDQLGDEMTAEYCKEFLENYAASGSDQPFFLSAGFYNPHQPFHVPQKYWDLYDLSDNDLTYHRPDSAVPSLTALTNRYNGDSNKAFDAMMLEAPDDDPYFYLRQYIHGYYASVSFVDDQLGVLLTALEENGLADNTIIIFTSDHGFHLGSKNLVEKSTLWNDGTAIPFVVKVPGQPQQFISEPISLVDLYPTLLEYGQVPEPESHELDGKPVQGIISGGESGEAILIGASKENLEVGELTEVEHSHHGYVRSNFKYIIYSSGEDELYRISDDFREENDLSLLPNFQGVRNLLYTQLKERIGYIRPPMPYFECLYYGDFDQDLNGWGPSEPNEFFSLSTDTTINSQHLVISGDAPIPITNKNVTFREEGSHELEFKAYSESEEGSIIVRIRYDNLVYLDTTFSLGSELQTYSAQFDVSGPLPPYDELIILIRPNASADTHIDEIYVRNVLRRDESNLACLVSEPLQTNVSLNQLVNKSLNPYTDQKMVECGGLSGGALQLWQHFTPAESSGIIGVGISQLDPIIEVFSECNYSKPPFFCQNVRQNAREFLYISNLQTEGEYYVRITSAKDLPYSSLVNANVKSIFIDAKPAELGFNDFAVLDENGSISLLDQPVFDYAMSEAVFEIEDIDSGDLFEINLDFNPSLEYPLLLFPQLQSGNTYRISARYKSNLLDVEIPFGPQKTFLYLPGTFIANGFVVFPNPAQTDALRLTLRFNTIETSEGIVNIFDMTGRKVFAQHTAIQSHVLNISGLPALSQGSYVVAFEGNSGESNQELLLIQ